MFSPAHAAENKFSLEPERGLSATDETAIKLSFMNSNGAPREAHPASHIKVARRG
jgi:hypothetical protein